jgi:hypothetical protein
VYVSKDGKRFISAGLLHPDAFWLSVVIAPSDPQRVYVSGYIPERHPSSGAPKPSQSLLRRSRNGGTSWEALDVSDFALLPESQIVLETVSSRDPGLLFARVTRARLPSGEALYRSLDGGGHWEKILDMSSAIKVVLLRSDGTTLIVGNDTVCANDPPGSTGGCVLISHNANAPLGSLTFARTAAQPHLACLAERADGTLLACGNNWEPDKFGLARSSDGETWEKVMRYSDIVGALECPADTEQAKTCARVRWPTVCSQLGICAVESSAPAQTIPAKSGGCNTALLPTASGALIALALLLRAWRRARARR